MLKSSTGVFFYFLLQNRFVWKCLNNEEKNEIKLINENYNNKRSDYNPQNYQLGKSWDDASNFNDYRGWIDFIKENISKKKIVNLCEIGPGSGYYTREIIRLAKPNKYSCVEINSQFREYLQDKISKIVEKENLIISKDIDHLNKINCKYDMIIFLSSLHHIPDREKIFENLSKITEKGSKILFVEPTHYIPRIVNLLKKYIKRYRKKSFWEDRKNLSTHHFCTEKEFKILSKNNNFKYCETKIIKLHPIYNKIKLNKLFFSEYLAKLFSIEFGVLIERI